MARVEFRVVVEAETGRASFTDAQIASFAQSVARDLNGEVVEITFDYELNLPPTPDHVDLSHVVDHIDPEVTG